jgi:hypothetical protein
LNDCEEGYLTWSHFNVMVLHSKNPDNVLGTLAQVLNYQRSEKLAAWISWVITAKARVTADGTKIADAEWTILCTRQMMHDSETDLFTTSVLTGPVEAILCKLGKY